MRSRTNVGRGEAHDGVSIHRFLSAGVSETPRLDGIPPSDYLASIQPKTFLENLENQKFSEGRSGSFFCFSPDKCFIIKTIPENEAHLLRQILPSYYGYIMNNPGTLLMRFYGLHAIQMQFSDQVFVCVMGNGFNTHNKIHEKYDLKGSWINRCVGKAHERDTSVLGMDMDLERMGRKVVVSPETRKKLVKQLKKDAEFLKSLDIMDYSILLGYHWRDKEGGPNQKLELKAQLKAKQNKRSGLRKIGSDMFSPSNSSRSSSRRNSENNTSASTPIAVVREKEDKEKEKEKVVYSVGESETPVLGSSVGGLSPLPEDLETGDGDAGHIFSESDSELASFSESFVGSRADPGIPTYDNSTEFYYLTVIDTLQLYDLNKKSERFWKVYVVQKDKRGISVQPPEAYCKRFVRAAKRLIITPAKCAAIVGQEDKENV